MGVQIAVPLTIRFDDLVGRECPTGLIDQYALKSVAGLGEVSWKGDDGKDSNVYSALGEIEDYKWGSTFDKEVWPVVYSPRHTPPFEAAAATDLVWTCAQGAFKLVLEITTRRRSA